MVPSMTFFSSGEVRVLVCCLKPEVCFRLRPLGPAIAEPFFVRYEALPPHSVLRDQTQFMKRSNFRIFPYF